SATMPSLDIDFVSLEKTAQLRNIQSADFAFARDDALAKDKELTARFAALAAQIKETVPSLQNIATSTYRTSNLKRVGARATIDHYQAMDVWFMEQTDTLAQALSHCRQSIIAFERSIPASVVQKDQGPPFATLSISPWMTEQVTSTSANSAKSA